MNPYEVLEISPGSRPEEIKAAYHRLAKQWHPDRFNGAAKAEAEGRFRQLAEAFNMLKDTARREEPPKEPVPEPESEPVRVVQAEAPVVAAPGAPAKSPDDWFNDARGAFEGRAFDRSLALITYAIRLDSQRGEFHAFHAKVLDVLQRDVRTKVKALETAIRLNPKDVDSTILLAQAFQTLGMQTRATRLWEVAYNLAPKHPIFRKGGEQARAGAKGGSGKVAAKEAQAGLGEQWTALVEGTKDKLSRLFKRG